MARIDRALGDEMLDQIVQEPDVAVGVRARGRRPDAADGVGIEEDRLACLGDFLKPQPSPDMGPEPAAAMQHDDQRPAPQLQPIPQHHYGMTRNPAGFDGESRRRLDRRRGKGEAGGNRQEPRRRDGLVSKTKISSAHTPTGANLAFSRCESKTGR